MEKIFEPDQESLDFLQLPNNINKMNLTISKNIINYIVACDLSNLLKSIADKKLS